VVWLFFVGVGLERLKAVVSNFGLWALLHIRILRRSTTVNRYQALELLFQDYNKEVDRYNRTAPDRILRALDAAVLKSQGLDGNEIEKIDLLMSRTDWAA
jgi:hypothetical protein